LDALDSFVDQLKIHLVLRLAQLDTGLSVAQISLVQLWVQLDHLQAVVVHQGEFLEPLVGDRPVAYDLRVVRQ